MGRRQTNVNSKICEICGNEFVIKDWQKPYQFAKQKCCSRSCNAKLSARQCIGKKAHNNNQKERVCGWCGKRQMVSPAYADRPYCSVKCMKAHYDSGIMKGSSHWNWQGGITEKPSRDVLYEGYKEWRKSVYKRDGYKCVLCGDETSGQLQAHHIKPRATHKDLIVDVSNGLTVCKKCHKEIHYIAKA